MNAVNVFSIARVTEKGSSRRGRILLDEFK